MIEVKRVKVLVDKTISTICDVCKKKFEHNEENSLEIAEFVNISFKGGFNSVFGDMNQVDIDICQHCFKKKLGKYVNIKYY